MKKQTHARFAKLAAALNMSADEGFEHYLNRFVFEPLSSDMNHIIAEEAEQIVCASHAEAKALAKRLSAFCTKNNESNPDEPIMQVSVVQYTDDWGVKAKPLAKTKKPLPLTAKQKKSLKRLREKLCREMGTTVEELLKRNGLDGRAAAL